MQKVEKALGNNDLGLRIKMRVCTYIYVRMYMCILQARTYKRLACSVPCISHKKQHILACMRIHVSTF